MQSDDATIEKWEHKYIFIQNTYINISLKIMNTREKQTFLPTKKLSGNKRDKLIKPEPRGCKQFA